MHEDHEVTIVKGPNIATYNLQIFAPDLEVGPDDDFPDPLLPRKETDTDKRLLADLPAMLETIEEKMEALLPQGYSVRVTEWNK